MNPKISRLLTLSLTGILLVACSGSDVKKNLGLNKPAPDEFMVLARPPLTVPPEFNLPAPEQATRMKEEQSRASARQLLFEKNAAAKPAGSAETRLLQKAGATGAEENIRDLIDEENTALHPEEQEEEEGFFGTLFEPITGKTREPVVDPVKEKERIATNQAEGKPVNEGDVPTTKQRDRGILDVF